MPKILRVSPGRCIVGCSRPLPATTAIRDGELPAADVAVWLADGTLEEVEVAFRDDAGQFTDDPAEDADGEAEVIPSPPVAQSYCPKCMATGDGPCMSKKSGKPTKRYHRERS